MGAQNAIGTSSFHDKPSRAVGLHNFGRFRPYIRADGLSTLAMCFLRLVQDGSKQTVNKR